MSQQSALSERSYFKEYRKSILVSIAVVCLVIVLVIPIVPIGKTVAKTRTRYLQYTSEVYGLFNVPKSVNVTNTDSIGGTFSITMNMWSNVIIRGIVTPRLIDTSTQSSFISARTTYTFHLPDNWFIMDPIYSFVYSVSPPSTQVIYNETQTEWKSILSLLFERAQQGTVLISQYLP